MTLSRHAAHSTRRAILAFAVMFAVVLGLKTALAQTEIDITGGRVDPLPIAIAPFLAGGGAEEAGTTIIGVDHQQSRALGLFRAARPGLLHRADQRFRTAAALRRLAADPGQGPGHRPGLSRGRQDRAEFRLWDVNTQQQLAAQQFTTTPKNLRRIGHMISDIIYKSMTGIDGYFDTRIVFVQRRGPQEQARQEPRHHGPGRLQPRARSPTARNWC